MKNIIGTIGLASSTSALGGCETAPAASPSETAGPALHGLLYSAFQRAPLPQAVKTLIPLACQRLIFAQAFL